MTNARSFEDIAAGRMRDDLQTPQRIYTTAQSSSRSDAEGIGREELGGGSQRRVNSTVTHCQIIEKTSVGIDQNGMEMAMDVSKDVFRRFGGMVGSCS